MSVCLYVSMYVCLIITVKRPDRSVPNFAHISNLAQRFLNIFKIFFNCSGLWMRDFKSLREKGKEKGKMGKEKEKERGKGEEKGEGKRGREKEEGK